MAIVKTITQSNRISLPAAGEDVPRARRPGEQDKSDQYSSPKRQPAKGELFGVCGELLFLKLPFLVAHRVFAKKRIAESKNQLNVGIGGDNPHLPTIRSLAPPAISLSHWQHSLVRTPHRPPAAAALMLGATLGVSLRLALGQWTFLPSSVATISYRIGGFVVGLEAMLMVFKARLSQPSPCHSSPVIHSSPFALVALRRCSRGAQHQGLLHGGSRPSDQRPLLGLAQPDVPGLLLHDSRVHGSLRLGVDAPVNDAGASRGRSRSHTTI